MHRYRFATAIVQVLFGLAVAFWSWVLAGVKAGAPIELSPHLKGLGITTFAPPPSFDQEFILIGLGLAVFVVGWLQCGGHLRGSLVQIIIGWMMTVIYLLLGIRAASIGYGERSSLYYLAYFSLALGLTVCAIGLVQAATILKDKNKTRVSGIK